VLCRQPQDDLEDPRQDVQVLVAVGVDEGEPGGLEALDLPPQLLLDLGGGKTAQQVAPREGPEIR
jgi:hypothetical protein